jgi:hypothetical protein
VTWKIGISTHIYGWRCVGTTCVRGAIVSRPPSVHREGVRVKIRPIGGDEPSPEHGSPYPVFAAARRARTVHFAELNSPSVLVILDALIAPVHGALGYSFTTPTPNARTRERECAYDRQSHVGTLDMAKENDWIIVDMKRDRRQVFPGE